MGNLLWKQATKENTPDETDGVITQDDITDLLYKGEEDNMDVIKNNLNMTIV